MKPQRDKSGKFPAYAWPGGYPILYLTNKDEVLCPDCANAEPESLAASDVYWEGPSIYCKECNAVIESAYGKQCACSCHQFDTTEQSCCEVCIDLS